MAGNRKKVYKIRTPAQIVLRVFLWLLIALVVVFFVLFFWLKRYINTDSGTLKLEVPFLTGEPDDSRAAPDGQAVIIEE